MHRRSVLTSLTAAIALALALAAPADAVSPTTVGTLADEIRIGRFNGVLAVSAPDRPARIAAGGEARRGGPANARDVAYPIGSITKPLTAVLAMTLVDAGKLTLDDTVAQHLPALAGKPLAAVTIRQLLSHTSGIPSLYHGGPNGLRIEFDPAELSEPTTIDAQIARFADAELLFEPGARHAYSNSGYMLLARIIEQAGGQDYATALRERVLQPAGIEQACYCDDVPGVDDAEALELTADAIVPAQAVHPTRANGAGGVRATPDAMLRLGAALLDGRILSAGSRAAMWTPVVDTDTRGERYALGWVAREHDGVQVVEHDGATPGGLTRYAIEPATRRVGFIALNHTLPLDQLSTSERYLRNRFRVEFEGGSADRSGLAPALATTAAALDGHWRLADDMQFDVATADARATLTIAGHWAPQQFDKLGRIETADVQPSIALVDAWKAGDIAAMHAQFDAKLRQAVPEQALQGMWQQLVAGFGEPRGHWVYALDRGVARMRLGFANGAVDIAVIRDAEGRVSGLRMEGQEPYVEQRRMPLWPTVAGTWWVDGYRAGLPDHVLQPQRDADGALTSIRMDADGRWIARR